jgi:MinD-like ATPase involved in chromosome partitioning or flagellar assembly
MPTIVIASSKGGSGKSTSAVLLATALAEHGTTVTVIDADINRPLSGWARHPGVPETLTVLSDVNESTIIDTIEDAAEKTAFVIVDLEGTASLMVGLAISRADLVIIPTQGSQLDAAETAKTVRLVKIQEKSLRLSLMRTILTVKLPNGATRRVQFLGGNDLDDPKRHAGVLTYSFDKRLIEILQDSTVWGKINLPVLMAFMSKYSVSLYENISQMVNLEWKQFHDYSIAEFRELMGVQDGQYKTFGEFNKHVLKPAVMEINALASFTVAVLPVKESRRVARIRVGWMHKDPDELREAMKEVESTKVGRKARISGNVELVAPPIQSIGRIMRTDRLGRPGTRVPRAS